MINYPKVISNNNYVIIKTTKKSYLYSYNKLIAIYSDSKLILTNYYNYSATTSKHLNYFIENFTSYTKEELKKMINNKKIKIVTI